MRPLAIIVALVPLLAGCTFGPGGPCARETEWSASWTQHGLYEALGAARDGDGFTVEHSGQVAGLPFHSASFEEAWGPFALTEVHWSGFSESPRGRDGPFRLQAGPEVTARLGEGHASSEVRALFLQFAAKVANTSEAQRAAWADALLASKQADAEVFSGDPPRSATLFAYHVNLTGPLRLEALLAEVAGNATPRRGLGRAEVTAGDWAFEFRYGLRAVRGAPDGVQFQLSVDALDEAFAGAHARRILTAAEAQGFLARAYRAVLPEVRPPSGLAWDASGPVC